MHNVDWSQNHAATAYDALDAAKMPVGNEGKTAKHRQVIRHPYCDRAIKRSLICSLTGCLDCERHFCTFLSDSSFQTIGVKSLKMVLAERRIPLDAINARTVLPSKHVRTSLQRKPMKMHVYISPRIRSKMMKARGHVCLFEVKCYAELAQCRTILDVAQGTTTRPTEWQACQTQNRDIERVLHIYCKVATDNG